MNAPFDSPLAAAAAVAHCTEAADLAAIFEDTVQIAVLPRVADQAILAYLDAAIVSGQLGSGFRTALSAGQRPDLASLHGLPALPGREAVAGELATLTELYGDLLGCDTVGLRLEVVGRAMCPRFHVDHVGIRMLCTYRGPGTQWLDEGCADRAFLGSRSGGQPDDVSGLIRDTAGIHTAPSFAIVLLKGDRWQGNAGRGIIHRSPLVGGSEAPRVLVAIDAVWD